MMKARIQNDNKRNDAWVLFLNNLQNLEIDTNNMRCVHCETYRKIKINLTSIQGFKTTRVNEDDQVTRNFKILVV